MAPSVLSYKDQLEVQQRRPVRPKNYEDLLLHPIADDPETAKKSYEDWEFDHGSKQRFYVGGFRWFLRQTGMNANTLSAYREKAKKLILKETDWPEMPNSKNIWDQGIARQQYNLAARGRPMFFQKAAMVIVSCEVAVKDAIEEGETLKEIADPEDVYAKMSIIPACWNVNDFNSSSYQSLRKSEPSVNDRLRNATGQESAEVFQSLADGCTVTYETARTLKEELDSHFSQYGIGKVRSRPGRHRLGQKKASEYEYVDQG